MSKESTYLFILATVLLAGCMVTGIIVLTLSGLMAYGCYISAGLFIIAAVKDGEGVHGKERNCKDRKII